MKTAVNLHRLFADGNEVFELYFRDRENTAESEAAAENEIATENEAAAENETATESETASEKAAEYNEKSGKIQRKAG